MTHPLAMLRRRSTLLVAVFLCIEFVDEIVDGLTGAAWPLIRADLGLSYTEIGLLLSVPALIAHIVEPPIGLLADIWRRFVIITLGGLAFATSLLLYAGATDFLALMAAMVLFYPSSGTFVSLSQSSMMDGMPGDEERGMVLWTIAGGAGVAIGPLMLAGAISMGWGWRPLFAMIAAAALLFAGLLWLLRPPPGAPERVERVSPRDAWRAAWQAIREPEVLRWIAAAAASDLLLGVFTGFLALYFVDEVGTSASTAAMAMMAWTTAALLGEVGIIGLLRRFEGRVIVRSTAWVIVVLFPAFMLADSPLAKLGLVALLGLLSAGWYSIVTAQFYRELQGRTGTAMAVSSVFGPVVGLVPAAVGLFAEHYGLGTALWLIALAPVGMLLTVTKPR